MIQPSAFIEKSSVFLSHPVEEGIVLTDHLLKVSNLVQMLIKDTKLENKKIPYYAALLHDIGKLNPYYQNLFYCSKEIREQEKNKLLNEYIGQHSIFSTWAASKLLYGLKDINKKEQYTILCLISAHHSSLKSTINSENRKNISFQNSKKRLLTIYYGTKNKTLKIYLNFLLLIGKSVLRNSTILWIFKEKYRRPATKLL
jgi:CRISPR-associated endonuclease Cas3-HD